MNIAVIGAGAFGSWTAFHLQADGHEVTLYDQHGPGNLKASSGGESRMIRSIYGPDRPYIEFTARSFELWKIYQEEWDELLYHKTGILWMFSVTDDYARLSLPILAGVGIKTDELSKREVTRKYPQINIEDLNTFFYEHEAGFLRANHACKVVVDWFVQSGGTYEELAVEPGKIKNGEMKNIELTNGSTLIADVYVFACGPWLSQLFPERLKGIIKPTRQEVFFFETPTEYMSENMPMWVDFGKTIRYGIPGSKYHDFKFADDTRGESFDPETGERDVTKAGIAAAKEYVSYRFPALKNAEIVDSRVCQYENTPDEHFIIDHHPEAKNCWLVGGGSGHGFKMGPALGECVANLVTGQKPIDPFFALNRFHG